MGMGGKQKEGRAGDGKAGRGGRKKRKENRLGMRGRGENGKMGREKRRGVCKNESMLCSISYFCLIDIYYPAAT